MELEIKNYVHTDTDGSKFIGIVQDNFIEYIVVFLIDGRQVILREILDDLDVKLVVRTSVGRMFTLAYNSPAGLIIPEQLTIIQRGIESFCKAFLANRMPVD